MYRDLIGRYETVLIGDLNSNAIWDATHREGLSHSAFVELAAQSGLVSTYHSFHGEAHGKELQPTFYFRWKQPHPYHIDYCFIPKAWTARVREVTIGSFEDWKDHSDHRPLLVDISDSGNLPLPS